jgi:hypothetical protein
MLDDPTAVEMTGPAANAAAIKARLLAYKIINKIK